MFAKHMFHPESFKNVVADGKAVGFQFDFKVQYYRGVTLSIIRDIVVQVDGKNYDRADIRFTLKEETFTLEEMRTVIDPMYRWDFGEWATVTVLTEGGLAAGRHHIKSTQMIAPSYMPMVLENNGEYEFEIL